MWLLILQSWPVIGRRLSLGGMMMGRLRWDYFQHSCEYFPSRNPDVAVPLGWQQVIHCVLPSCWTKDYDFLVTTSLTMQPDKLQEIFAAHPLWNMVCDNCQTRCVWLLRVEQSGKTPAVSSLLDSQMKKVNLCISGSVCCLFTSARAVWLELFQPRRLLLFLQTYIPRSNHLPAPGFFQDSLFNSLS